MGCYFRGSSQPRDQTVPLVSPAMAGGFFTTSTTYRWHYIQEKTGEWLYWRSSHSVVKVLRFTAEFPTWESGKRTEKPQGIWLLRPVGFDYRISTGLGKQTLVGHKQKLVDPGPRREEQWPLKRLSHTCLWVSRILWQSCELTVACCEVMSTKYNSPRSPRLLA